ncbi:hypothetical protein ROZALSC1DRAFT_20028 [Rozella allomycis CSF55]|uniref:Uncharacterized protein n=1 Tax=Rozella allomycis (strain CSF55) TaxID=988480 RepID=A0A4P9YQQ0_ROZAC|nr:hypothetical protein ROZALSC1DRAFT_20028 [Rozella allomycis CSF55]
MPTTDMFHISHDIELIRNICSSEPTYVTLEPNVLMSNFDRLYQRKSNNNEMNTSKSITLNYCTDEDHVIPCTTMNDAYRPKISSDDSIGDTKQRLAFKKRDFTSSVSLRADFLVATNDLSGTLKLPMQNLTNRNTSTLTQNRGDSVYKSLIYEDFEKDTGLTIRPKVPDSYIASKENHVSDTVDNVVFGYDDVDYATVQKNSFLSSSNIEERSKYIKNPGSVVLSMENENSTNIYLSEVQSRNLKADHYKTKIGQGSINFYESTTKSAYIELGSNFKARKKIINPTCINFCDDFMESSANPASKDWILPLVIESESKPRKNDSNKSHICFGDDNITHRLPKLDIGSDSQKPVRVAKTMRDIKVQNLFEENEDKSLSKNRFITNNMINFGDRSDLYNKKIARAKNNKEKYSDNVSFGENYQTILFEDTKNFPTHKSFIDSYTKGLEARKKNLSNNLSRVNLNYES